MKTIRTRYGFIRVTTGRKGRRLTKGEYPRRSPVLDLYAKRALKNMRITETRIDTPPRAIKVQFPRQAHRELARMPKNLNEVFDTLLRI